MLETNFAFFCAEITIPSQILLKDDSYLFPYTETRIVHFGQSLGQGKSSPS